MPSSGGAIITNYHFTTTKAHIELTGATCLEIYADEALRTQSTHPFKGNMDPQKLRDAIKKYGRDKIGYIRMEATTNLVGGQLFTVTFPGRGEFLTGGTQITVRGTAPATTATSRIIERVALRASPPTMLP